MLTQTTSKHSVRGRPTWCEFPCLLGWPCRGSDHPHPPQDRSKSSSSFSLLSSPGSHFPSMLPCQTSSTPHSLFSLTSISFFPEYFACFLFSLCGVSITTMLYVHDALFFSLIKNVFPFLKSPTKVIVAASLSLCNVHQGQKCTR